MAEIQPASRPIDKSAADSALEDLKRRRQSNPLIEPSVRPLQGRSKSDVRSPLSRGLADLAIRGIAPGAKSPKLRREGEFVRTRKGRLVHAANSRQALFQFEADSAGSPEPPMVLMPCRLLESMEELVFEQGDWVVFIVTGQVFVYREVNYLLPTMFKLAVNKGNLQM